MKIGIMTFHYAHNYGAILQAYALKKYLESLNHEVYIIPYINRGIQKLYPAELVPMIPKKRLINPMKIKENYNEIMKVYYSKQDWGNRYQLFMKFISTYLTDQPDSEWEKISNNMDCIFFGSDQIWEKKIIGNDFIYIGKMKTKAKKISYAASCYSQESTFTDEMISLINDFTKISVRETDTAMRLSDLLKREVAVVSDPVFLLEEDDFNKLCDQNNQYGEYILFYFVAEDEKLSKICSMLRKKYKKRVIEIHYYRYSGDNNKDYIIDVGPVEFLNLIKNAEAVYTNSFHGTALSIIFEKQFFVKSDNMRLVNLLRQMSLEHQIINGLDEKQLEQCLIDYNTVADLKKAYIASSKEFINSSLQLIG